jgi:hypothetical protein
MNIAAIIDKYLKPIRELLAFLDSRFTLFWAMAVITFTVWRFFKQIADIQASQATVIVAIIGLLSIAINLYQRDK